MIVPGKSFQIGGLAIETRLTAGHSIGGISYVIYGLARPVAVVGDALFSSSMGGGVISFPKPSSATARSFSPCLMIVWYVPDMVR